MATALTFLILSAGAGAVALLVYKTIGAARAVSRARARSNAELAQSIARLSKEGLRQRLLQDPYLVGLRRDAAVQALLTRVAQGDDVALASDYPRAKELARRSGPG